MGLGVLATGVTGFVFALRAGVVLGPLVALVLWRGVGTRALLLIAGGLLTVGVPGLYLIQGLTGQDPGGFDTTFATDRLAAHWLAVGAYVALTLVLLRLLSTARARRGGPAPAPGTPDG